MLVSINIVAYNEENNIEKSLFSALNQSYKPIEVFLIDNASRDRTVGVAKQCYESICRGLTPHLRGQTPSFKIIRNAKNLGFGAGHNVGFKNSSGGAVLCLNADCELDKEYVKNIMEVLSMDNRIGAVQGKLLNPKNNTIDTTGLIMFKNRRVVNRGQGEKDDGQYENSEEIWGVDGAAPVYRREALDDVVAAGEYFDEDFFAYKEDIDLSWRMRWAGWGAYYEPHSVAYHDRSAGEGVSKFFLEIILARRAISTFAKYHSFANQRLMQIKNETPHLFLKYAPAILVKEVVSWPYVLIFEGYGIKSAFKFFKLFSKMMQKRRFVMAKKRISDKDMEKWFI